MQVQIKKELVLTLNEVEINELKAFMVKCPIWQDGELMFEYYGNNVVGELWEILNK